MIEDTGIQTVPVIHRGPATASQLQSLIGASRFDSAFENPVTRNTDHLMEGLYCRTETSSRVTGRAKMVRPEFVEKVKQSEHWQRQKLLEVGKEHAYVLVSLRPMHIGAAFKLQQLEIDVGDPPPS